MSTRYESYLLGLTGAVSALAVAALFAPWLRTGSATRNSFQVVQAADHLDVLPGGPQTLLSVVWAFVPLLAVLGVLALIVNRAWAAAGLLVGVGFLEAIFGVVVMNAPRSADWGAKAGLAVGLTLVVAAAGTTWTTRSTT